MWRPFEENCEEEMVDVETIFDNNEENEVGSKKKRLQKFIRIGGCKAVSKETARLTGVNETTVSKILMRMTKNFLKKSKRN
ncbi:unnamed protein product [Tenebrio molitor]|nr:unnamed protein product [Tenebrio molitor]